MPPSLVRGLNSEVAGRMTAFPASVAAYGKPGGGAWADGDRLVLPDLSKSLAAIAESPDAFYTGWIADRIAEDMAANGGLITKADLAAYKAVERAPVRGTFLGHEIISMPPPSSGGVALIEMLNILEEIGIQKTKRGSAGALHLVTEAMRRAFLDRARFLGDPDFVRGAGREADEQAARARAGEGHLADEGHRAARSLARTSSPCSCPASPTRRRTSR